MDGLINCMCIYPEYYITTVQMKFSEVKFCVMTRMELSSKYQLWEKKVFEVG